ncbi:MAG: hypothetical protein JW861_08275, partial [Bacteroidales bacterium]|nr:hypothetical protein [Bacteroidales bacterium]
SGEIIFSHDFEIGKLIVSKRDVRGTGSWTFSELTGPPGDYGLVWPRAVSSGLDRQMIHVLGVTIPLDNGGNVYNGQDPALLYNRSADGGQTWNIQNQVLPGTGSSCYNFIGVDGYPWAEPVGNTIAFAVTDPFHDLFVMKSDDQGDTWQKIMVWEHPYPFFDWDTTLFTDTLWAPDRSADITIDPSGMVHVVFGLTRTAHFYPGQYFDFWPFSDGIAYWNETRPPFSAANPHDALDPVDVLIEDYNLVGWTQDVNNNGTIDLLPDIMSYRQMGLSTMPEISIDDYGSIFLVYCSTTETYDNGTFNYKRLWGRGSADGGATWGSFLDLNTAPGHLNDECIYPVMAGNSDGHIHLIYQADTLPGSGVYGNHAYHENRVLYYRLDKSDLIPNVPGISTFPYSESFEAGFGDWQQSTDDDFDWTRNTGPTPTPETGPPTACEGDYYLYTESSYPNYPGKSAGLYADFNFSQWVQPSLSFWYHMYGTSMGTLKVQASTDSGVTWSELWSMAGNQGDQWQQATVNLSACSYQYHVRMRFLGTTGEGYLSDMAIDFVEVTAQVPPPSCTTPVVPQDGAQDVSIFTSLVWNSAVNADGYLIWFGTDDPPSNIEIGTDLGDVLVYEPASLLDYATTYYWKIVPYGAGGPATGCPVWSFTTMAISGPFSLNVKAILEGPFDGTEMATFLNGLHFLPMEQPYDQSPWYHDLPEQMPVLTPAGAVDWVLVELREAPGGPETATGATVIDRQACLIMNDGMIMGPDGSNPPVFTGHVITQNLYVVLWHRNHLGIMSNFPLIPVNGVCSYDFTNNADKAYGGVLAQKEVNGHWTMVSADGNADGTVNNADKIDIWKPQAGLSGYLSGDYTMNGYVDNADKIDRWTPNAGRTSQVPVNTLNNPPVADFTVTPLTGDTATLFAFDASLSSDPEDPPPALRVRWDLDGDGTWDFGWDTCKTATWKYNQAGSFLVMLQVIDTDGLIDTDTATVTVLWSPPWSCGDVFQIIHTAGDVAPVNKTVDYGTVLTDLTGTNQCWITQNLGADHQAASATDATEESAGWYWQFNRKQGYKHDGVIRTPNTPWNTSITENADWQGANDPCTILLGTGWRLPTYQEWYNADLNGGWNTVSQTFASVLKLHAAGYLGPFDGSLYARGSDGFCWSSSQETMYNGWSLFFCNTFSLMSHESKTSGFSVRCLRE